MSTVPMGEERAAFDRFLERALRPPEEPGDLPAEARCSAVVCQPDPEDPDLGLIELRVVFDGGLLRPGPIEMRIPFRREPAVIAELDALTDAALDEVMAERRIVQIGPVLIEIDAELQLDLGIAFLAYQVDTDLRDPFHRSPPLPPGGDGASA
jgi:hypothetical protein